MWGVCRERGRVLEGGGGIDPLSIVASKFSHQTTWLVPCLLSPGIIQGYYTCGDSSGLLHMWGRDTVASHVVMVQDYYTCGDGTGLLHMWGWHRTTTHVGMIQGCNTCGDSSELQYM